MHVMPNIEPDNCYEEDQIDPISLEDHYQGFIDGKPEDIDKMNYYLKISPPQSVQNMNLEQFFTYLAQMLLSDNPEASFTALDIINVVIRFQSNTEFFLQPQLVEKYLEYLNASCACTQSGESIFPIERIIASRILSNLLRDFPQFIDAIRPHCIDPIIEMIKFTPDEIDTFQNKFLARLNHATYFFETLIKIPHTEEDAITLFNAANIFLQIDNYEAMVTGIELLSTLAQMSQLPPLGPETMELIANLACEGGVLVHDTCKMCLCLGQKFFETLCSFEFDSMLFETMCSHHSVSEGFHLFASMNYVPRHAGQMMELINDVFTNGTVIWKASCLKYVVVWCSKLDPDVFLGILSTGILEVVADFISDEDFYDIAFEALKMAIVMSSKKGINPRTIPHFEECEDAILKIDPSSIQDEESIALLTEIQTILEGSQ